MKMNTEWKKLHEFKKVKEVQFNFEVIILRIFMNSYFF